MNIVDPKFPKQTDAILDKSRFKTYNCSRRSGKTIGLAKEYIQTAYEKKGSKMIYFALTGQSAYDIIWSEILDECDRNLIPTRPNKVERRIYFPEVKSSLKIAGADASEREIKKVLGQKYSMAGIDECGSFTIDMHKFVYQMIRPALVDLQGSLTLIGTCENIPNTFFEKACTGQIKGWSVHRWTAYDNPYVCKNWELEIKDLLADNPLAVNASWFRTHYLNEWVTDGEKMIIPLKPQYFINEVIGRDRDYYVLGVDLGYNDATSFTVVSYSGHHKEIIFRSSYKKSGLDITDTTNHIKELQRTNPIHKIVVDGANKQAVEEMRKRHGLPLHAAEKIDKSAHLRMLKDDFVQGNAVIVKDDCEDLEREWSHLIWLDEMKQKEDPRCENHCCFPAGVKISGVEKDLDIKDIKVGDYVLTTLGPKRVTGNIIRIYDGVMVNLQFSDGTKIKCTDNHPFYTEIGLVCADSLTYSRRFTRLIRCKKENMENQNYSSSTGLSIDDTQNQKILISGATLRPLMIMVATICIMMFIGFIMGTSQKVNISIILMGILQITIYLIWYYWGEKSIEPTMLKVKKLLKIEKSQSLRPSRPPQNGTDQEKGKSGIKSTAIILLERVLLLEKITLKRIAEFAKRPFLYLSSLKTLPFVLTNATQKPEEIAALITSQKNANGVIQSSLQINTPKIDSALSLVSLNTEIVKDLVIYNLTVEDNHQYFANGVLVSNSDSALYAWRECKHYTYQPIKQLDPNSNEFMDAYEREQAELLQQQIEEEREGFNL